MRTSILGLILACALATSAQPFFEGKVSYRIRTDENELQGTCEAFFGNQKIRAVLTSSGQELKKTNTLIIDFSKQLSYDINDDDKTYQVDSVMNRKPMDLHLRLKAKEQKNILGQPVTGYTINTISEEEEDKNKPDFLLWYADTLYFPVAEKMVDNLDVSMFTNGKTIGLGMSVSMVVFDKGSSFHVEAIKVERQNVPDSLFEIPKGYTLKIRENSP